MKKEDLKPFTFYYWSEEWTTDKGKKVKISDVCFITDINKTSSPGNYQCGGIEIESLEGSDLVVGNGYNYHFLWGGERSKGRKYTIKELNFNNLDRKKFFDWLFDSESALVLHIYLHYIDSRFK